MLYKKDKPTNSPKINRLELRMSDEDLETLNYCVEKTGNSKSDIIREGIREVYDKIKKQKE